MSGLLSPLQLTGCELRNRLALPPMASETGNESGLASEDTVAHYEIRAQAGIGLIIVEHTYVTTAGRRSLRQLGLYSDAHITPMARVAAALRAAGAVAAVQLTHAGGATTPEVAGQTPEAPSGVGIPGRPDAPVPAKMSVGRIAEIQTAFAEAAVRAWRAGFQMVELHSAHGYLLNQFFSPLTNKRTDAYGGSRENRLRFVLETTAMVREALPEEVTVAIRLGADDGMAGGLVVDDAIWAAPLLIEAGVGFIDISGGLQGYGRGQARPEGYFAHLSEAVKRVVDVPVMVTGGVVNPRTADRLIREGAADVVGVGRPMLADAAWAQHAISQLQQEDKQEESGD